MKKFLDNLTLIIFVHLILIVQGGQCVMNALVSFQDCQNFCIQKYGTNLQTQRMFYNMQEQKCQKKVQCGDKLHRMFQNRCVRMFQQTIIENIKTPIPQIYLHIKQVVIHGNSMIKQLDKKCYPGFISSRKRKKIKPQVFQQLLCDIPIGSDPYNYPQSHGQYFFQRLTINQQTQSVELILKNEFLFSFSSFILMIIEIIFFISLFRYHKKKCYRKIQQ